MKKVIKNILLSLFIVVFLSLNVNAKQELGLEKFNVAHTTISSKLGFQDFDKHTASDSKGNNYNAYCISRKYGASNTAQISRILGTDESLLKYDTAVLEMLKGAENQEYEVGHIALRIFANAIDAGKDNQLSIDADYQNDLEKILDCFLTDEKFIESYNAYTGKKIKKGDKKCTYESKNEGNNTLGAVKALIKSGLDVASNDLKMAGTNTVGSGPTSSQKQENGKLSKVVSVKVSLKGILTENDYFKYKEYKSENQNVKVTLLGYSKKFNDTTDGWQELSSGTDLSKIDGEKAYNGDVYIGFLLEMDASDEENIDEDLKCENFIIQTVFESNGKITAALLTGGQGLQVFYAYIPDTGTPKEITFDLKTSLCEEVTCDPTSTLPNICEDGSNADENGNVEYEFREAYNSESGKYNIKKCLLAKNSKDKAGNEYTLEDDENASMVNDNPYCEVKCKEDYKFGVPYKRNAEAGRYFQISVALKGTQDCYTTKLDYKKYTEDVVKKQEEIIEAYNDWLLNYENHKKRQWSIGNAMKCSNETCDESYNKAGEFTGCSNTSKDYGNFYNVIHSDGFINPTITEGADKWTISVDYYQKGPTQFGKFKNEKTCSRSGNSCDSDGECEIELTAQKDWEKQDETFQANINKAKANLRDRIKELREIVDKYNSCAADHNYNSKKREMNADIVNAYTKPYWDMVYNYDPEIIYSYDEPEPGISSINWINSVSSESCQYDGYSMNCDRMYSSNATVYAEKCQTRTDNKVSCPPNVKQVNDIDGNSHAVTWYCDGDVDNQYQTCTGFEELTYSEEFHWMVEDNDLNTGVDYRISIGTNKSNSKHIITNVDYVRKTASSEGTYNTARVYYSMHDDGTITIKGTPEMKIENADIVDGLPVSINTPTGTYYYKLTLNNIGSFYSEKNSLGRIFGTSKSLSNEVRSEATAKGNKAQVGKNEYACTYEVNQNTCEDSQGNKHYKTECEKGENWEKCQERLCPVSPKGPFCVEKSQSYYVCNNTTYDSSCKAKNSREEALAAVGCKVGEACEQNFNCCPNCKVECIGQCSITNNGSKKPEYDFRPVSPGNLFPTDRDIGYNWESNPDKYHNSLVARKAGDTITEITKRANDVSSENGSTDTTVEDYTLKVTMNADMISKIKAYNKEQKSYNNDTMNCIDYPINITSETSCKEKGYTWQENKCILSNIFCTSSFIDQLIDGDFGGSVDMKAVEGRTADIEKFTTYTSPYGVSNSDNLITTNDYWTIYRFSTLDVNGDGIPDVGPSWK